jgi:hypothetical protein
MMLLVREAIGSMLCQCMSDTGQLWPHLPNDVAVGMVPSGSVGLVDDYQHDGLAGADAWETNGSDGR